MVKPLRVILVIVVFLIFFEVGLLSSYTIVTSEIPDIKGLVDMQIEEIASFFNPNNSKSVFLKEPSYMNISNKKAVSLAIENMTKVDGIDLSSVNASAFDTDDSEPFNVTIHCLGYASPEGNSSQIVLDTKPSYKIEAIATAKYSSGKLVVDVDTIKIKSILKLYS